MRAPLAAPHQIQVNQALNPNVETTLNGWASNGGLLYPVSRDTSTPISGLASCMTTRSPNLVTGGANGTFEGGVITSFIATNMGPGGVIAADATIKRTGSHSLKATWGTITALAGGPAYTVSGLTIGSSYTVECWLYVPAGSLSAGISMRVSGLTSGTQVTVADTWTLSTVVFTATSTSHLFYAGVNNGNTTAGMIHYADDVKFYLTPVTGVAGSVYNSGGLSSSLNLTPVTPGVPITWSFDVKTLETGRRAQITIPWRDAANTATGSTPSSGFVDLTPGRVGRVTLTAIPPPTAAFCYATIAIYTVTGNALAGELCWFDNCYAGSDPSGAYFDGSSPGGSWNGTVNQSSSNRLSELVNLCDTPNCDDGQIGGWTTALPARYPVTADSTAPISGTFSAMVTRTADTPNPYLGSCTLRRRDLLRFPVVAGRSVTSSFDLRVELANRRVQVNTTFYDSAGAIIGSGSNWVQHLPTGAVAGQVYRLVTTSTPAPANAATVIFAVEVLAVSGNTIAGERCWFDNVRISDNGESAYLDGGSPGCAWAGTPHASASVQVGDHNRAQNPNLESVLTGWYTNDGSKYWVSRDLTAPISGVASALGTRLAGGPSTTALSSYMTGNVTGTITFPAVPGVPITWAIDIRAERSARRATFGIGWRNASNANIGSSAAAIADLVVGQVTRLVATGIPPAAAAICYGSLIVLAQDGLAVEGERIWYDNMYIGTDPAGAYFDGASPGCQWAGTPNLSASFRPLVHPYNQWNGSQLVPLDGAWLSATPALEATNYALNPIADTANITYWWTPTRATHAASTGFIRCTVTDATVVDNAQRMVTPTGGANIISVTPGQTLWVSGQVRSSASWPMHCITQWLDASYVFISQMKSQIVATNPSTWTDLSVTGVPPVNAVFAVVQWGIDGVGPRAVNDTFDVRHVMIIKDAVSVPYFDGDTPDSGGTEYRWSGTAHASTSQKWTGLQVPAGFAEVEVV